MFNEYAQDTSMFGEEHAICRSWICVSYLPAANAEQEAHDIALLLLLQLLEILVGTHLYAVLATAFCFKLFLKSVVFAGGSFEVPLCRNPPS